METIECSKLQNKRRDAAFMKQYLFWISKRIASFKIIICSADQTDFPSCNDKVRNFITMTVMQRRT